MIISSSSKTMTRGYVFKTGLETSCLVTLSNATPRVARTVSQCGADRNCWVMSNLHGRSASRDPVHSLKNSLFSYLILMCTFQRETKSYEKKRGTRPNRDVKWKGADSRTNIACIISTYAYTVLVFGRHSWAGAKLYACFLQTKVFLLSVSVILP